MIEILLYILMGLSFLCFLRVIFGPSVADRMVAIDIFGILVVGICALLTVKTGRLFLIDIAIAWILLSFIGTITLAKYLAREKLDE
ncbi:MAG: hypothetical protein K9N06_11650 [Candidatus Cloacimonetes bacterium]|nr:hypothetical protein [Candidatus Cloacimonadota bacterium]